MGLFLRVQTDKALYRAGDAIDVSILSNATAREVIVDLSGSTGLLASEVVHLGHGRAQVSFPYDPRFHGELHVTAFVITGSEEKNHDLTGERQILFPGRQESQLKLTWPSPFSAQARRLWLMSASAAPKAIRRRARWGCWCTTAPWPSAYAPTNNSAASTASTFMISWTTIMVKASPESTTVTCSAWDSTKPFPDGLDLLAEAVLKYIGNYESRSSAELAGGGDYTAQSASIFNELISNTTTTPISKILDTEYKETERYPRDAAELKEILKFHGLDFDKTLDPWDVPYRVEFSISGQKDLLTLISNGPDKRTRSEDDFTVLTLGWPYFRPIGKLINEATFAYQRETGKYIRDYATLRAEMKKRGTDLDALRDPWGRPYRFTFSIAGPYYGIHVTSAGPDGIFDAREGRRSSDDVAEWSVSIHYFLDETAAIERALAVHYAKTGVFPQDEQEFKTVLNEAKLAPQQLVDQWGEPYHFSFAERSRYWDQVNIQTQTVYGQEPRSVTKVVPVTQKLAYIDVLSNGPKAEPPSPFVVAEFSRVMAEYDAKSITSMPTPTQPPVAGGHGTLRGTVVDPQGAVVVGVTVTITSEAGVPYTATTQSEGSYEFTRLPTGLYQLRAEARGFQTSEVLRIPVQAGGVTIVNVKVQVGSSTETVEVSAGAPLVETTTAQISSREKLGRAEHSAQEPMFTPRLRKYFPETLLWRPEVITDKRGHAHFTFNMADNITAWSMSVVATNEAGQVGTARKELRTFLPFFLEHDPPKILTQGDIISLPVVLRNVSGQAADARD